MSAVSVEILIVLLLIVLNGVFSMSELAVMSARKARLQQRADEGDAGARVALELAEAPNRFLSTVQFGITLIGILAGAYGGATLSTVLASALAVFPVIAPYSQTIAFTIVVLLITFLSLVIGELVPKRLALHNAERVAALVAMPMNVLSMLVTPIVHLLSLSTDFVLRLLRLQPNAEPPVTEEEVKLMIEQGTEAGVFAAAEQDMVEGIFRLADQRVNELMTPRPRVVWLDTEDALEDHWRAMQQSDYSYFPVCEGSLDDVIGIVAVKDIWASMVAGRPVHLRELIHAPVFVPESMPVLKLLETLKATGQHLALVIDEYAGIQGLITLNDVLEAIVGDLSSLPTDDSPIRQREDGSWLVEGILPVADFKDYFEVSILPGEERGDYQTLGGFVMRQLGRIPIAGDHFEWGGLRFEVVDMDRNRVDKVLVTRRDMV